VSKKSSKDRLKIVIDFASIFLYQLKELIYSLLLKVKKQKLMSLMNLKRKERENYALPGVTILFYYT